MLLKYGTQSPGALKTILFPLKLSSLQAVTVKLDNNMIFVSSLFLCPFPWLSLSCHLHVCRCTCTSTTTTLPGCFFSSAGVRKSDSHSCQNSVLTVNRLEALRRLKYTWFRCKDFDAVISAGPIFNNFQIRVWVQREMRLQDLIPPGMFLPYICHPSSG